jgi:hypothetical protein
MENNEYQRWVYLTAREHYSKSWIIRFYQEHFEPSVIILRCRIEQKLKYITDILKEILRLKFDIVKLRTIRQLAKLSVVARKESVAREFKCICCKKAITKYSMGVFKWREYCEEQGIKPKYHLICSEGKFKISRVPKCCVNREPVPFAEIEKCVNTRMTGLFRANPNLWGKKIYTDEYNQKLRSKIEQIVKIMQEYYTRRARMKERIE